MTVVRYSDGSALLVDSASRVQVKNVENFIGAQATVNVNGLPDWVAEGPGPIQGGQVVGIPNQPVSGAIQAVAIDPRDPLRVYVGTAGGGVWRSSDRTLYFQTNHNDVVDATAPAGSPASRNSNTLNDFLAFLKANPTLSVHLVGHTDNVGDPAANVVLGNTRANAVQTYLTGHGIDASRITVDPSPGQTQPMFTNTVEAGGRELNRRVEMLVYRPGGLAGHWQPLTDFFPSLSIRSLAIDPANPNTIYAGTGTASNSATALSTRPGTAVGILKSTDGGDTWQLLQGNLFGVGGHKINKIAINSAGVILVATNGGTAGGAGLFLSADGAVTFRDLSVMDGVDNDGDMATDEADEQVPATPFSDVVADPGDPTRFYAAAPAQGVYITTNTGNSWNLVNANRAWTAANGAGFPSPTDGLDNDGDGAIDEADEALPTRIMLTMSATNDAVSGQRPVYAAFIGPIFDDIPAGVPVGAVNFQVRAGTNLEPGDTAFIFGGTSESSVITSITAPAGGLQTVNLKTALKNVHGLNAPVAVGGSRLSQVFRSPNQGVNWTPMVF